MFYLWIMGNFDHVKMAKISRVCTAVLFNFRRFYMFSMTCTTINMTWHVYDMYMFHKLPLPLWFLPAIISFVIILRVLPSCHSIYPISVSLLCVIHSRLLQKVFSYLFSIRWSTSSFVVLSVHLISLILRLFNDWQNFVPKQLQLFVRSGCTFFTNIVFTDFITSYRLFYPSNFIVQPSSLWNITIHDVAIRVEIRWIWISNIIKFM